MVSKNAYEVFKKCLAIQRVVFRGLVSIPVLGPWFFDLLFLGTGTILRCFAGMYIDKIVACIMYV